MSHEWFVSSSNDEMSDEKMAYVTTAPIKPTKPLDFPYHDVTAWLGFGCDKSDEWAFVGFSTAPNLSGGETEDGYHRYKLRAKWDDQLETSTMTQEWQAGFLHFQYGSRAIKKMLANKTLLLEFPYYSEGKVLFKFSLVGAADKIADARAMCKSF